MPERRIIADLTAMPIERIKSELDAIRAERAQLDIEEQLLSQVLRLRTLRAGDTATVSEHAHVERIPASPKRENVSAKVLDIVRHAERRLLPADVRDRLANEGVESDLNAIRVALRRWVERGELEKHGRLYSAATDDTLMSSNGSAHSVEAEGADQAEPDGGTASLQEGEDRETRPPGGLDQPPGRHPDIGATAGAAGRT